MKLNTPSGRAVRTAETGTDAPAVRPVGFGRRNSSRISARVPLRSRRLAPPGPQTFQAARQELDRRFAETHPRCAALWNRARDVLAAGVTHDGRFLNAAPLYVTGARGARKRDRDGYSYIDYWMGHGSLLLGHGRREVIEAVHLAAQEITHPGACHEREVLWAERIRELVPTAECVRFAASGSEATALAVRLARALTGRDAVVKFEGHFHGWLDHLAQGVELPFNEPWTRGAPGLLRDLTIVLPANDLEQVEQILRRRCDIAAVILEPTGAAGGAAPVRPEFLGGLRDLCSRHGAKLIFDEVITGFRVAPGGAQERFGIRPDLTCLAKILAGGLPGGAVCGPRDSFAPMDFSGEARRDRLNRVVQYGTFNANPLSAAAGIAALGRIAGGAPCRAAEGYAQALRERLNALFRELEAPLAAYGFSSIFHLLTAPPAAAQLLRDGEVEAVDLSVEILKKKHPLDYLLRRALQLEGVDLPAGKQAWISEAHGEEELTETLAAFGRAIALLRGLHCF